MEARKTLADRAIHEIAERIRASRPDSPGKAEKQTVTYGLNALVAFNDTWAFTIKTYKTAGDSLETREFLVSHLVNVGVSKDTAESLILEFAYHDKCSHIPRAALVA
ncbi:MAG TPA: hypothetical protein VMR46_02580 [Candidatus Paceibacterota bacterium]|jgi:hypothetical protein|nr:hypothetical protein [Candidatus Paceibacterota bacterium]